MRPRSAPAALLALALAAALLAAAPLAAQQTPAQPTRLPVVRIDPFTGEALEASELRALERLVGSHLSELGTFRLVDEQSRVAALEEAELALALGGRAGAAPAAADFILSGGVERVGELMVFSLAMTRARDGARVVVSETGAGANEIAMAARALTLRLVGAERPDAEAGDTASAGATADSPPPVRSRPSLAMLAGSWRGDKGLETVRLYPNGTGLAVLAGGGTLRLRVRIEGDLVEIVQDQPNDPAMYRSPQWGYETARFIASKARPMRWIFSLSADGAALFGAKESVGYDGVSAEVDNGYRREARWDRLR